MSDCGVCLGEYDGYCEFYNKEFRKARKERKCYECHRPIPAGQQYEYAAGKSDGDFWSSHTCMDCAEIAESFSCRGRTHGILWDDMAYVFEELTTGCFDRLVTSSAKSYLRERWLKWKGLTQ